MSAKPYVLSRNGLHGVHDRATDFCFGYYREAKRGEARQYFTECGYLGCYWESGIHRLGAVVRDLVEHHAHAHPAFADTMATVGAADDLQAQADALRELERVTRDYAARPEKIEVARAAGAKWADIASSLGMSVTAARKLHAKLRG